MRTPSRRRPRAPLAAAAAGTLLTPLLSGCRTGAGGTGSGGNSINVLRVNHPQTVEPQKLTRAHFTRETGIEVNFTVLPENDVRDKISQDFADQAGRYDAATLSNYEIPLYARNGWLHEMDSYVREDSAYDERDILKPTGSTQPCVTLQGDGKFIPVFDRPTDGVMRHRANVACDRRSAQTSAAFLHAPARSESERA